MTGKTKPSKEKEIGAPSNPGEKYIAAFFHFIETADEAYLVEAADAGREMVQQGIPLEQVIEYHHLAIGGTTGVFGDLPLRNATNKITVPLLELIMAYGLAYREQIDRLAKRENELTAAFENMAEGIALFDQNMRLAAFNKNFTELYALPVELARPGVKMEEILRFCADRGDFGPGDVDEFVRQELARIGRAEAYHIERKFHDKRVVEIRGNPLPEGGCVITYSDVTEFREQENRLRQGQRMEALGKLTGGIAHDFNNVLQVITGNLQLVSDGIGDDPKLKKSMDAIVRASMRAAELTQRMLAFGRQQSLDLEIPDFNELVSETRGLLGRTLGADIALETKLADDLWLAAVDQSQLQNAILNLALNARDAMPGGGKLMIETANAVIDSDFVGVDEDMVPGRYIMLAVTDNGAGMPLGVIEQVFEPFFTTKEVGQGSGLGLSMIHGYVKQSGGHITISSEIAHGTTVKLYFPKNTEEQLDEGDQQDLIDRAAPTGSETILVVEDDPDVGEYVTSALAALGYTILEAVDGPTAIQILDDNSDISMLFTDVVLPNEMNGRQIAEEYIRRNPSGKVLYSSGYAKDAIVSKGNLKENVVLLRKPYTHGELASTVRQVLDSGQ